MLHKAIVTSTSPLKVKIKGDAAELPARLPTSPSITLAVGADVVAVMSEGQLIILARLA